MGSFLRSFKFGHVRQLDAVASRAVALLAGRVPGLLLLPTGRSCGWMWMTRSSPCIAAPSRAPSRSDQPGAGPRGFGLLPATLDRGVIKTGSQFSIGARLNKSVATAIATIDDTAWVPIVYPNAIVDPDTGELISSAEVAYMAFTSHGTKGRSPAG